MDRFFIKYLIFLVPLIAFGCCEQYGMKINSINSIPEIKNQTDGNKHTIAQKNINNSQNHTSDMQEFSTVIFEYIDDALKRDTINLLPGITIKKKSNVTDESERRTSDKSLISAIQQFANNHVLTVNLARASTETGRLFFFKGMNLFAVGDFDWPICFNKSLFLWDIRMVLNFPEKHCVRVFAFSLEF